MRATITGHIDHDGAWKLDITPADGETLTVGEFIDRVLVPALAQLTPHRNTRIPTKAEAQALAARRALPPGWTPTLDGHSTTVADGGRSHARTYQRTDGSTVTGPCDPRGEPVPLTADALRAYDAAHPLEPAPPPQE